MSKAQTDIRTTSYDAMAARPNGYQGSIDSVINDKVLSRLYGAQIEVIRHRGRYFVMLGNQELDLCNHDDLAHGRHAPV